ncbi:hypothetical protein G6F24_018206 [Rhizopus arrhizus]|nr:hypothetical protein G6F24_018206 [Rhizopus arrhizus]
MDVADERQRDIPGQRGQERLVGQPRGHRRDAGGQQADPDPVLRVEPAARLHPVHAAHHVLQDDGGGEDQSADKAAAGLVVAAQQEVHRNQRSAT